MDVDAEELAEFDREAHGGSAERFGRGIGVPEAVKDEGKAGDVGRKFGVETVKWEWCLAAEIDIVVVPGGPDGGGFGGGKDDVAERMLTEISSVMERAEDNGDGCEIGRGEGCANQVLLAEHDEEGEEAFDQAVVFLRAEFAEKGRLDTADDAEDGGFDEGGCGVFVFGGNWFGRPE